MLELTHGSRSNERVSTRVPGAGATPELFLAAAPLGAAGVRRTCDSRQLRALAIRHGSDGRDLSERLPRIGTLEADWNFCDGDSMQRSRARVAGLPSRSNRV
jgi:hypothetical protein